VSIRFQADNDLNMMIVSAVLRKEPRLDFKTAQQSGLHGMDDLEVLALAASEGRILITHDRRTMIRHLATFLSQGHESPGVLLVIPQNAPLGPVIETIILIWESNTPEDWQNTVTFVPF